MQERAWTFDQQWKQEEMNFRNKSMEHQQMMDMRASNLALDRFAYEQEMVKVQRQWSKEDRNYMHNMELRDQQIALMGGSEGGEKIIRAMMNREAKL